MQSAKDSYFRQGLPNVTQFFFEEHPILSAQPEFYGCVRLGCLGARGQFRLLRWKVDMSLLKQFLRFSAVFAIIAATPVLKAQEFHPFVDPLTFDPDWQWFAPVDNLSLAELSPKKRANTGWFASHDRSRLWLSRPDGSNSAQFNSDGAGDFVWGHRTDLGFMRDNGSGWMVNFRRMSTGCGIYHVTQTERINRFVDDDAQDLLGDRNDPFLGGRFYEVKDSLNVGSLDNFEVNKTWRKSPYRYGGILEPFVGFRYSAFMDVAQDQNYSRSNLNLNGGPPDAETQLEILVTDRTRTMNQMLGGQLGARYFTHYHRWRVGGEARAFLAGNYQTSNNSFTTDQTYYDGSPASGVGVTSTARTSTLIVRTNDTLVWGYELRADAAYQLTKYISVRGGLEAVEFVQGIWRGGTSFRGNTNLTNQDVFMAGITFGVELNR